MRCPICDVPMREVTRRGVKIDVCPECKGVWLDRGELDHLIEAVPELESEPAAVGGSGRDERSSRPPQSSESRSRRDSSDDDRGSSGYGGSRRDSSDDDRYRSGSGSTGSTSSGAAPRKKKSWLSEMFEFGE